MLADGNDAAAVYSELGVSEQSYHRWRSQDAGLEGDGLKSLKSLEMQNGTLKRLLAEAEMESRHKRCRPRGTPRPRQAPRRCRSPH
jgi:putative transposase